MSKNIVMNTFSGRYLLERSSKNIGHENINFFKPNGCGDKFFLYFNCDGTVKKSMKQYDGEITLLMVTNFANEKDKFRILGLAKKCHIINGATIPSQREEAKNKRHRLFMEQFPNVTYGNVSLEDIYLDNTYQGKLDGNNTLATFWVDEKDIFVPKNENLTIQIKDIDGADIKQNMANEKMRMLVKDNENFERLTKSIEWLPFDSKNNCLPRFPMNSDYYKEDETFFTATHNQKDELTLSNIIAFSLQKNEQLSNHLTSYLIPDSKNVTTTDYEVKREDKHVDLTILLPDKTIIIENKIDSTIVEYAKDKKVLKEKILKVYKDYKPSSNKPKREDTRRKNEESVALYNNIINKIDVELNRIGDNEELCQLTKYFIQSKIDAYLKDRENLPIYYFFLVPNYTANKFRINDNGCITGYAFSENYKLIKYSDLLHVFEKFPNIQYGQDILAEFRMLSSPIDDFDQKRQIYSFLKKAGL